MLLEGYNRDYSANENLTRIQRKAWMLYHKHEREIMRSFDINFPERKTCVTTRLTNFDFDNLILMPRSLSA